MALLVRITVTALGLLALATASAQAKSEHAVFSLTVEGQGQGAWLNPVGEGCVGDGNQAALRGSMRETLQLRSPAPTLVTISGLNGNAGPMRMRPLDRRVSAPTVAAQVTREGSVEYLDCKPAMKYGDCPEIAARTRPSCHAPRAVQAMDGCFGTRTFTTTVGLGFEDGMAMLITSPPSQLESAIFACEPEDMSFRPSSLIPGSTSLRTRVPLPRSRLQRARAGTEIVLRGPDTPGRDATTGCKASAPATCERYSGALTFRLRFVRRARRTGSHGA